MLVKALVLEYEFAQGPDVASTGWVAALLNPTIHVADFILPKEIGILKCYFSSCGVR
jgi:hypothetical protein